MPPLDPRAPDRGARGLGARGRRGAPAAHRGRQRRASTPSCSSTPSGRSRPRGRPTPARAARRRAAARRPVHRQGQPLGRRHRDGDRRARARRRRPARGRDRVARIRAAGGILLGKTNCPEYGGGIETDNAVYGRTSNPYDLARTPGGSSGGEAATSPRAARRCGLGTDSGASVRLPAHFCGLAALKPTAGRVPLTGVIDDEGQLGTLGDPRTQVGPLARSVATSRCCCASSPARTAATAASRPVALGDPRRRRPARACASRSQTDNGLDAADPGDGRGGRGGRGGARRGRRAVEEARHPRRRARAHDRRLALLRRRRRRRRPVAPAAPLGRVPRRDARLRARATTCSCAPCSPARRACTAR